MKENHIARVLDGLNTILCYFEHCNQQHS